MEQGRHYKHEWELEVGVGLRVVDKVRARAKADRKWSGGRNENRIKSVNRSTGRIRGLIGAGAGLRTKSSIQRERERERQRDRAKGDEMEAGARTRLRAVTGAREEAGG